MTVSSILTMLAHTSAPFLSTFLVIHPSAPIAVNIGGSRLASSVMLLGREYYQTTFGERYLLLLPFTIHVTSSVAKWVVLILASNSSSPSPSSELSASDSDTAALSEEPFTPKSCARIHKLTSLLSVSAYGALFLFIAIHVVTHRLSPAEADALVSSSSDINLEAFGCSKPDSESVKTPIKTWSWLSWMPYMGLVGSVLVRTAGGASIIQGTSEGA
ncbi:hypothetical protein F5141DRAFT_1113307 [Pisolithus sp. B1]|nr:hypothetical protein F5141DRAFT_1113307 [Pisolithus sp. B1]